LDIHGIIRECAISRALQYDDRNIHSLIIVDRIITITVSLHHSCIWTSCLGIK